jgi:hypothetical protein
MNYLSDSGEKLRVHGHPSDQSCHWVAVLKPLVFTVFHVPILIQSILQRSNSSGKKVSFLDGTEYARWLCQYDESGVLNLVNVLLHVCELRGMPSPPLSA